MVPGSLGCGSAVLAAIITLAPSLAQRNAMALPMPRDAPLINIVFPAKCLSYLKNNIILHFNTFSSQFIKRT